MVRFHLKKLIADWEFKEGRRLTIAELAEKSGVTRPTLSRLLNQKGYNTTTDILGRLCRFFDCKLEDLAEYIPDEDE